MEDELTIKLLLHKLVNQIAILSNYAYLLRESDLNEDQSEMVDEMVTAANGAIESHRLLERRLGLGS